jgi:SpoVK/Ycf46/Vps4 family AAA+-type ATPase
MTLFDPAENVLYRCRDGRARPGIELVEASGAGPATRPRASLGRILYGWDRETDDGGRVREYVTTSGYLVHEGRVVADDVLARFEFESVLDPDDLRRLAGLCDVHPEKDRLGPQASDVSFDSLRRHADAVAKQVDRAATAVAERLFFGWDDSMVPVGRNRTFTVPLPGWFYDELQATLESAEWCGPSESLFVVDRLPEAVRGVVHLQRESAADRDAESGQAESTASEDSNAASEASAGPDETTAAGDGSGGVTDEELAAWFEEPTLDFDDVAAMADLKAQLRETVIYPLEDPSLYSRYGLGTVNGILLYGPPGTGKTYLSRALAGELGYTYLKVTPANVTSKYVGEAAENVERVFELARRHQPTVVFIDEIDAFGTERSRTENTQSERQMQNQLLLELAETQDEDVVVVAATNRVEELDTALTRRGRFDERIEVPLPNAEARYQILLKHLEGRPVDAADLDREEITALTRGFSASDVEALADHAAREALKDHRETGSSEAISQLHVLRGLREMLSMADQYPVVARELTQGDSEPRPRATAEVQFD